MADKIQAAVALDDFASIPADGGLLKVKSA